MGSHLWADEKGSVRISNAVWAFPMKWRKATAIFDVANYST
jgi:hypothetical protein